MDNKVRDKIFWIIIILIVILGIYLVFYVHTQSFQCIANPYSYPIKLLERSNNETVSCSCTASSITKQPTYFSLDRNGLMITKGFGYSGNFNFTP